MDCKHFKLIKNTFLLVAFCFLSCRKTISSQKISAPNNIKKSIITGAQQTEAYLPLLKDKRIAIVGNPTSVIFNQKHAPVHLVDSLIKLNLKIKKVFAPEHGFRGTADAGEIVKNGIDIATGIPIISLYGKNKKPSLQMLDNVDIVIFDIQDVGARFYTYISTLHYIMEACAEANLPILILDRPNPNGHYIDGPILELEHKSFVGMHPIPVVHGMTIGEYAKMINGEKWLAKGIKCELKIIPIKNYTHNTKYSLPIKPSPNLPNATSINLYPSLCLFEGTNISVGRGTDMQFQIYGAPDQPKTSFVFTPKPNLGAKHPKHNGKTCFGKNLSNTPFLKELNLNYLIDTYANAPSKEVFFNNFFTKLAGTKKLQYQIEKGLSPLQIQLSWKEGIESFKKIREKYLLYE